MKRKYSNEVLSDDETITKFLSEYNIRFDNNSNIFDKFKNKLNSDLIQINLNGSAGQSWGAFLSKSISLKIFGDANDYVA